MNKIIFIGGPSAVGKSRMGKWLADHRDLVHIELDGRLGEDRVDALKLRAEWDALLQGNSRLFRKKVPCGTVITLPSLPILTESHAELIGVSFKYLIAPAWVCLREFERRERQRKDGLPVSHWMRNNNALYDAINRGIIPSDWLVPAFDKQGAPIADEIIAGSLCPKRK